MALDSVASAYRSAFEPAATLVDFPGGGNRHIVHIVDAIFRDKPGGSRQYAREVALRMVDRGQRVTFLAPRLTADMPLEESVAGCKVVRYASTGVVGRQAALARSFQSLHAKDPVDGVVVHFAYTALGYHALAVSRRIPTLRVFHGPWDLEAAAETGSARFKSGVKGRAMYCADRFSLHRSHRIVALSEFMANDVRTRFGIPDSKIEVVPGGVDTEFFSPGDQIEARTRLHLPPEAFCVFTVRRLARRMGLDLLVEAAAIARRSIPGLKVLIAGKGPLAGELSRQITDLGLEDCVRLLGFVPSEELPYYYRAADLFALPTLALEGFGLVILEALASNTPVLGTPTGAIPDVLAPFGKDLVFKGTTAADIAEGIVRFQHSAAPARDYRKLVLEHYTWDAVTDRLLDRMNNCRPTSA